jgi:putative DNA primase/helicase
VKDATTNPDQIKAWWRKWPDANIGVATGRISGIVVIDADPRNGSNKTIKLRVQELGPLSRTVKARSGGGGTHRVYEYPDFKVNSDSNGKLRGPGLDVLSDGSYFVAPCSRHISGNTYAWFEGKSPDKLKPAALPEPWLKRLRPRTEPKVCRVRGKGATKEAAAEIVEGQRNVRLTSLAGKLWRDGISHEALLAALQAENEKRCKPPLDQSEVKKIADSISKYPVLKALDQEVDLAEQVLQLVLHEHFEDGQHLMFYGDSRFWRFDRRKWAPFRDELFDKCVLRTVKNIPHKQNTTAIIGQVRQLARAHLATGEDLLRFEGEPAPVINCKNGELWIANDGSVELRPHNAKSYLRHCLDVEYDADAECPLYDQTVQEIFVESLDAEAMVRHWHEFVGYIISQRRNIPLVPILLGRGRNGKTKLMETGSRLLGPALVHHLNVEGIEGNRFAIGSLLNKALLLDDDVRSGIKLPDAWPGVLPSSAASLLSVLYSGPGYLFRLSRLARAACHHATVENAIEGGGAALDVIVLAIG